MYLGMLNYSINFVTLHLAEKKNLTYLQWQYTLFVDWHR